MTKQDIIEYVMTTPHNTNKAVLSSMLNQLAEGGSGSSDFSTAEVTINITPAQGIEIGQRMLQTVAIDFPSEYTDGMSSYIVSDAITTTNSINILLYQNVGYFVAVAALDTENNYYSVTVNSMSGDIAFENGRYVVSGNCVINGTLSE